MATEACDVCGGLEKKTARRLISVCDCYKKFEDRGRMHLECLKQHLATLSSRYEDRDQHTCPRCHKAYRVSIRHRFVCDWRHVCTARSLNNLFELAVVMVTLLCCVGAFLMLDYKKLEEEHTSKWLLFSMAGMTLILVVFTIKKVYGRWRKASSDVFVSAV